jgi:2,3-bisphosphoglycerate-independent phosphoglycerate mutase
MGLLSDGGVHSHLDHMHAAIQLAYEKGAKDILVHAFLDGRDTPPQSAEKYIRETQTLFANLGIGRIASLCGRYYAMDRDKRWQRVECAYQMIVEGKGQFEASTPLEALEMAYQRQETDEFVQATVILDDQNQSFQVNDNDAVIFMNFRADRARELSYALANSAFSGFERNKKPYCHYVTLTQYAEDIEAPCAYPPARLINGLGDYLAKLGKKQLRLAETEKYAHVTFFFNGGVETVYKGENRILVPSPRVATYDLKPEMSAYEVTDNLVEAINASQYDLIVCNYANADMVGHTGNYDAAIQAIEALDHCLKRVVKATRQSGMTLLITADHGNADKMKSSESNSSHTAHTTNLVPFVHVGAQSVEVKKRQGKLSDIAPTVLNLMHLKKPDEMTGEPIFTVSN